MLSSSFYPVVSQMTLQRIALQIFGIIYACKRYNTHGDRAIKVQALDPFLLIDQLVPLSTQIPLAPISILSLLLTSTLFSRLPSLPNRS